MIPNVMTDDNQFDIDTLIARYFASEATEEEMAVLLKWMQESEDNRKHFFELHDVWHALSPSFAPEDIDTENAEERILVKSGLQKKSHKWLKSFVKIWSRLAAILLLPLLIFMVYKLAVAPKSENTLLEIATTYGCTMKSTLPDGSTVWLNANSVLKYPAKFVAGQRYVELSGEGYFNVKSDQKNPFIVHTSTMSVKATGTEFNVNSYRNSHTSSVTLVQGRVDVDIADNGKDYGMIPGEYLTLNDGKIDIKKCENLDKYCSWRNGILMFDGDTLEEICERLQQIYNIEFEIKDSRIASSSYRMILQGENINDILHLLELSAPIKCSMETVATPDSIAPLQRVVIDTL